MSRSLPSPDIRGFDTTYNWGFEPRLVYALFPHPSIVSNMFSEINLFLRHCYICFFSDMILKSTQVVDPIEWSKRHSCLWVHDVNVVRFKRRGRTIQIMLNCLFYHHLEGSPRSGCTNLGDWRKGRPRGKCRKICYDGVLKGACECQVQFVYFLIHVATSSE